MVGYRGRTEPLSHATCRKRSRPPRRAPRDDRTSYRIDKDMRIPPSLVYDDFGAELTGPGIFLRICDPGSPSVRNNRPLHPQRLDMSTERDRGIHTFCRRAAAPTHRKCLCVRSPCSGTELTPEAGGCARLDRGLDWRPWSRRKLARATSRLRAGRSSSRSTDMLPITLGHNLCSPAI